MLSKSFLSTLSPKRAIAQERQALQNLLHEIKGEEIAMSRMFTISYIDVLLAAGAAITLLKPLV